ncbi:hypothetical protein CYK57_00933 [Actinobacillus pleuropneumoniae]|uniref:Uncharacterized protein n=1 Tax=Actinobacillus pleuropneumoniae serovar 6 str. Femo TaxID=754256 RepID=A0A828PTB8_ACTPL|nr:hypothetical protein appser4_7970 [Actinobacillus pleuropneumoniae serovar 4 str. M62]EFM92294.1 hypothetical protein appser6_8740 [Actinobacillus pleuropneumoniae serovar 6 str. Femo]QSZ38800.1 hypothetical protein CYK57_00933 [Actinobacillus pleuropneumoniae]
MCDILPEIQKNARIKTDILYSYFKICDNKKHFLVRATDYAVH